MHMCIIVIVTCSVCVLFFILHAQVVVPVKKKEDGAWMV